MIPFRGGGRGGGGGVQFRAGKLFESAAEYTHARLVYLRTKNSAQTERNGYVRARACESDIFMTNTSPGILFGSSGRRESAVGRNAHDVE